MNFTILKVCLLSEFIAFASLLVPVYSFAGENEIPVIISGADKVEFDVNAPPTPGAEKKLGVMTKRLYGDPSRQGLTTVIIHIEPHTKIGPLFHTNNAFVTILSGQFQVGFGRTFINKDLSTLGTGDFYTEPSGSWHYAQTDSSPAILAVTTSEPGKVTYGK